LSRAATAAFATAAAARASIVSFSFALLSFSSAATLSCTLRRAAAASSLAALFRKHGRVVKMSETLGSQVKSLQRFLAFCDAPKPHRRCSVHYKEFRR
jgi:hypothetical protein